MGKFDGLEEYLGFLEFGVHGELHGIMICNVSMLLHELTKPESSVMPFAHGHIFLVIAATPIVLPVETPTK
jgi:hypothetical protein